MLVRLLAKLAFVMFGIAIAALLALYWFQDKLIFVPNIDGTTDLSPYANPPGWRRPTEMNIPYDDVYIETEPDCKLHGWLMKQPNSRERPTIIFFHGNAGNIGHRLPNYAHMYKKLRVNIFASSYRGYGLSSGVPSERAFFIDAAKVIEYLKANDDIDQKTLIVFGRSIGGAVAIEMARLYPFDVRGVILENSFWSLKEMAVAIFKPLSYAGSIVDLLIRHRFDNGKAIAEVAQPIMFISGQADEIVPPIQMKRLFDAAVKSVYKLWVAVADGTHNETWLIHGNKYYQILSEFIESICLDGADFEEKVKHVQLGKFMMPPTLDGHRSQDPSFWNKMVALVTNEFGSKKEL